MVSFMRNKPFTTPNSDLFTLFFHASELTIFKLFVCVELCENNVTFVCVEICGNFVANLNHHSIFSVAAVNKLITCEARQVKVLLVLVAIPASKLVLKVHDFDLLKCRAFFQLCSVAHYAISSIFVCSLNPIQS